MSDNTYNRINRHNKGWNKTTAPYSPFHTLLIERYSTRKEARDREKYLKSGIGREFLDQLQMDSIKYFGYMPGWRNW